MIDSIFVNLTTEPFMDFAMRGKGYEIRGYGRGFTKHYVYTGRRVELRWAWSRGSLWGTIGEVVVGTLDEILDKIDYKQIEPRAVSREEAVSEINKTLKNKPEKYIAFQVILDSTEIQPVVKRAKQKDDMQLKFEF